jgi:pimeloyl-[acyl-carrier protein] methyl ester esterase
MIILISGWGATDKIWSPVITELGMPCQCLPWQDCLGDSAQDNALLRMLQASCEPSVLVGWSLGALVAQSATLANPERVASLVLIGGTARMTATDDYPGADARSLRTMRLRLMRNPARVLGDFCQQCLSPARDETFTSLFLRLAETLSPEVLMAGLEYLLNTDLRVQLPQITVPTMLVHGSADQIIPLASAQYLASHLRQAELKTIPEAGHALPHTHAADIAALIRNRLHVN